ncbi:phage major capsid protein [Xanthomonas perforans]|uniref:phage major capsid protein n=2 Tax=Xanthomonas perforans TaxID=442694 RepID=UPI000F8F00A6|nr:phage major capsid protein [Xanthomonas perforans]MDC9679067.1 phage major capsid protein [Xanthomonas perforans]MDC9679984.1 phage major capsid protein [Xanthomonas perforans]MDC9684199.1 phage major capsid protein [Xanthomonas perforans]MDS6452694.1 phage major capsid protein [Xanthomonas perforans]MDS6464741.1 phage major capsid protein [Xanthomonas perforans]
MEPGPNGCAIFREINMTIQEQLEKLRATREAQQKKLNEVVQKSMDEGRSMDTGEKEEFDNIEDQIKALDDDIERYTRLLAAQAKSAVPAAQIVQDKGSASDPKRAAGKGPALIHSRKNEEQGIGFARFAMAMYAGKGDVSSAKAFSDNVFRDDVRLNEIMKAAVAAGNTTDPSWAGSLVQYQNLSTEFVDFLRPRTIIGQLGQGNVPGLRRVPFNVRIPGKTAKGRAQWVGEGYRKPVTKSGYDAAELKWAKIAGISVITEELARFADPSIQTLVRDDLSDAVIERMDEDFVDIDKATGTGAGLSPASITNGVTPIVATGDPDTDIAALWETADDTNLPVQSAVYITDSATARVLATRKNALGNREYPGVTMTGGNIDGVPLVVSNYVATGTFILAFTSEIYLADDGVVTIDISREATIIMDDDATATPTIAQIQSMFQTNQLAIRAERYVNWKKRRPQAVALLTGVDWKNPVDAGGGG